MNTRGRGRPPKSILSEIEPIPVIAEAKPTKSPKKERAAAKTAEAKPAPTTAAAKEPTTKSKNGKKPAVPVLKNENNPIKKSQQSSKTPSVSKLNVTTRNLLGKKRAA